MKQLMIFAEILIFINAFFIGAYSQINGLETGSYILNDFDFNKTMNRNDFFANTGAWNNDSAVITFEYDSLAGRNYFLKLNYDVSKDQAMGGWFETLKHSYIQPDGVGYFDISDFDRFHLSYRGEDQFTTKFKIEFVEYGTWNKKQFVVNNVTTSWQETVIDLDSVKNNLDPTKIRNFAIFLEHDSVTQNIGTLHFDNFFFVDTNETYSTNDDFFDLISQKNFLYFINNSHPVTGLIRDKSSNRDITSIAANGFGLAAFCIGAERNWISRSEAAGKTKIMLEHLLEAEQSQDTFNAAGYKGFFYHLLTIDTPIRRDGKCELSSIDTDLFLAGVILAREYFNDSLNTTEIDIRVTADSLYNRVDWKWMSDTVLNQFRMAWFPENDSFDNHWDHYTDETIMLCILGIASGKIDKSCFYSWQRPKGIYGNAADSVIQTYWGSLFTYFFAHNWVNLNQCGTDSLGVNWWENSKRASEMNRQFCIDSSSVYYTYSDSSWGISACDGPNGYNGGISQSYGALPMTVGPPNHDGTIPPYGPGNAVIFFSEDPDLNESVKALKNFYNNYPRLWNIYGFSDAFNLGTHLDSTDDWYSNDYFAIDVGSMLMMTENYRTGLIWNYFMNNDKIKYALDQIFNNTVEISKQETEKIFNYKVYPNPTDQNLTIEFTLDSDSRVTTQLYNTLGIQIAKWDYSTLNQGHHKLKLNLGQYNLTPGIYYMRLCVNKINIVLKIVYTKQQ